MKSYIIHIFLSLSFPLVISGQAVPGSTGYEMTEMNIMNPAPQLLRTKSAMAYGTDGSPYVFEDFKRGNIFYANKLRVDDKLLNYDCYNDRWEYSNGKSVYLLNSSQIDYFEIFPGQGKPMLFKQVFLEKLKKHVFLQVLYNDNSILYKRYFKEFREADYGGAYSQDRRYDEYHDRQAYYLQTARYELQMLKPKKKSLLKIMEDKREELDKYMKKENPGLKTDDGLVQLIRFYDSLE
jgi:hypothetical protein